MCSHFEAELIMSVGIVKTIKLIQLENYDVGCPTAQVLKQYIHVNLLVCFKSQRS